MDDAGANGAGGSFSLTGSAALAVLSALAVAPAAISGAPEALAMGAGALGLAAFLQFRVIGPLARRADAAEAAAADMTERLAHIETHDPETGLPNARAMAAHLDLALAASARSGRRVGVCQLDLTGLRRVAELHGREAGETALRRAAGLIRMETRKGDLVARTGPTSFCIVSMNVSNEAEAEAMAARLSRAVRTPFAVGSATAEIGCAAGIVLGPLGEADGERLAVEAAAAARAARETGGNHALFTPALKARMETDAQLRDELSAALDEGRIEPWFQPQIRLSDGVVTGAEALARWIHPERGVLAPGAFFPVAEEAGLMDRIDETILDRALDSLVSWRRRGLEVPLVGVNVNAGRLADGFLAERIKWALEARDLEPGDLAVEVIESVLIGERDDDIVRSIQALARIGVRIDIDDFGTGHASIASLKRVKVDRIKIDRGFISGIDVDDRQEKVARAMVEMAKGLGIAALAEGVETPGERAKLLAIGCAEAQGFGIARPMPAEALAEWLRAARAERLSA
ncbi:MAG: putative bifunctional diguanylate cyclase/phosphodiesterase [Pikeienuella sp.]|uniref:putative bifunctional diguanylate cyclase/phosphodiesterase n=1 Tax=Pikeienuella sp. TaxID=2831957 RepID=UPI0039187CA1